MQLTFEATLDVHQVTAVETARHGRDLTLAIWYAGTTSTADVVRHGFSHSSSMVLTQSDWTRVLTESAFAELLLVEIPLDRVGHEDGKVAEPFRKAQDKLRNGDSSGVIQECRIVLDVLKENDSVPARAARDTQKDQRSKDERLREIYDALHSLCSPAAHGDANAQSMNYTRPDAIPVLSMTAALMQALPMSATQRGVPASAAPPPR